MKIKFQLSNSISEFDDQIININLLEMDNRLRD